MVDHNLNTTKYKPENLCKLFRKVFWHAININNTQLILFYSVSYAYIKIKAYDNLRPDDFHDLKHLHKGYLDFLFPSE